VFLKKKEDSTWSHTNVRDAIGTNYARKRQLKKIGVLLQHPYLFSRCLPVLKHLDRSEFDILYITCSDEDKIRNWAKSNNFNAKNLLSVIRKREQYKIILSHNIWFALDTPNGYVPSIIGDLHIRLMYSSGFEKEELDREFNLLYDAILCYGPRQEEILKDNVKADIYTIGNPRLDTFFNFPISHEWYKKSLNLDNRKNILWLPTVSEFNSIKSFIKMMDKLTGEYNVILSPHALISDEDRRLIQASRIKYVFEKENNLYLMAISDFVFCDHGGSPLTAIYLDMNVVLLDIDAAELPKLAENDSSEFYIREYIGHYSTADEQKLLDDLKNEDLWNKQKEVRQKLSKEFFADYRGISGYWSAKILKKYLRG
jgi:hypothetical protein